MTDQSGQKRVKGEVVLTREIAAGAHQLHLLVEDVSRADAAAIIVGRRDMEVHGPLPAGTILPFEIGVDAASPRARYSVRAHLDRSGSGRIEAGDLISTEAYPVLDDEPAGALRVSLRPA